MKLCERLVNFELNFSNTFSNAKNGLNKFCRSWWVMNFGYSWIFELRPFRGSKISLEELKFKNPKFDMLKIRQIFLGPRSIRALRSTGSHRPNYPRETPLPSYSNVKSSTPTTPLPPLIHAHRRRHPTLLLPPPHPATAPRPRPPSLIRLPNADSSALLPQAVPDPLLPRLLHLDFGGDVWSLTRNIR
jgi:hypothetical protein